MGRWGLALAWGQVERFLERPDGCLATTLALLEMH